MSSLIHHRILVVLFSSALVIASAVRAGTILQTSGANFVAFEAEENVTLTPGTPTSFVITNDVTPSGDKALYASGANNTAAPTSFATYRIKFATPGIYNVFLRWRANQQYTDNDPNSANSYYTPLFFNSGTGVADYRISSVNNTRNRPESNVYGVGAETPGIEVTQAQVDAGAAIEFRIGTREAGMMFDRFVLTLESPLTEAQFNALPNSDTDVFEQPAGANYVAFEAETHKVSIIPGSPTSFVITNDTTPSGNEALYASGANNTAAPTSFAIYLIKFSTPGIYNVFLRWRANQQYTDNDPNSANSYYTPLFFNSGTGVADYRISSVNNTRNRPESNVYGVGAETPGIEVTQAQVDAGVPLAFRIGTREAGMMFDRFVLSLEAALTEAQFNALENTGASVPPVITRVVASGTLTDVKVTFSKQLEVATVFPSSFQISGNVTVQDAVFDPNTMKDVTVTTSPQTENTLYTLTVNDISDLSGGVIAPNTMTNFFSWRQARGFARRELYLGVTGADVASLQAAAKFPNSPDIVDVVRGLASVNLPRAYDYGVRLTAFFIPPVTGTYDFFMYNNDDALLSLSTDDTAANLQGILGAPSASTMEFNPAVFGSSTTELMAGQRYLIQVLLKQSADFDVFVNVAARRQGDPTPVEELKPLDAEIFTFVDPLAATINIPRQAAGVATTSGNRARFEVAATSPGGPIFYQWQRNGVNIPAATRAAYFTPVLSTAENGDAYRAIIYGGGAVATSAVATVTVNAGPAPTVQPFIGVNFVGGGVVQGFGASLGSNDVVGVVPQGNYNNLAGGSGIDQPLVDANGEPTSVTATFTGATYITGTGESTTENILFQGYLHNSGGTATISLINVPAGTYHLIAYSVGFNFNTIYDEAFELIGGTTVSPVYYVRAEHAGEYNVAPSVFRRMVSTDPSNRDRGNYVMFENVHLDTSGVLTLTVTNEATAPGGAWTPALNGLQLVRVSSVTASPTLAIARGASTATISWGADAQGFVLESHTALGVPGWQTVAEAPNPIAGAGSLNVSTSGGPKFYRLRK